MKITKTLPALLMVLAGGAACLAAEEGYGKFARQRELARLGQQAESAGSYKAAAKAYRKSRLYAMDNRTRAELLLREAECQARAGKPYAAFDAYKMLLESFPLYTPYDQVIPRLRQLAADFERGKGNWLGIRNRTKAVEVYELLLQEAPAGAGAMQDSLSLGSLLTALGRGEEAVPVYREALRRFPGDPLAPKARLELGRLLAEEARTGDGDGQTARQAVRELRSYLEARPDDPGRTDAEFLLGLIDQRRADALYSLARFYLRDAHRREPAARRYLEQVMREYPQTTAAAEAQALLASLGPAPAPTETAPEPAAEPPRQVAATETPPAEAPSPAPAARPEKRPQRRLLEGLLPDGVPDEGPPRQARTIEERERVDKWLLPLGSIEDLKAGGGSQ